MCFPGGVCFPGGAVVKNPPASEGDTRNMGSIPGLGSSPGVGNGNPLQYSCLGNPIDREAWRATVHEVPKSLTGLSTHSQHEFNSPEEVVNNADCCR